MRRIALGIVIHAEGEDVADLLIESRFRCPDVPNAGEEFIEVVEAWVLEAFVIHDEALHQVVLQRRRGPLPKLGAAD